MIVDKLKAYALYIVIAAMAVVIAGLGVKLVSKSVQVAELAVAVGKANEGKAKAEKELGNFRTEQATKTAALESTNRQLEGQLNARAVLAAKEKEDAVKAVRTELDAAIERMRKRSAATPFIVTRYVPGPDGAPTGVRYCTPDQLSPEDGAVALRIAAEADELRAELGEVRTRYTDAQEVALKSQQMTGSGR